MSADHKKEQQLLYQIAINMLPGIGSIMGKQLVAYCGGAEAVMSAKKSALFKIEGIGPKLANMLKDKDAIMRQAEKEIDFVQRHGLQTFFFTDKDYPNRLKQAVDSPLLLYYKGTDVLNYRRVLAIVGTRKMTEAAVERIEHFVAELKAADIMVVSGLAYGVDAKAQRTAVKHKMPTVGVVAHGLDRLYPAANRALAKQIQQNGGVLTEFPSGTNPDAFNFPARNRIIAGMADATLVIESAAKGGSLITADIANSYNRDVFAVPGRPDDVYARGCNFLIKTNKAALVENAKDLMYKMMWEPSVAPRHIQKQLFVELNAEEALIVNALKERERWPIDELAQVVKMKNSQLAAILLSLEFKGMVKCLPGSVYRLL